jgi:hypothetical protein
MWDFLKLQDMLIKAIYIFKDVFNKMIILYKNLSNFNL